MSHVHFMLLDHEIILLAIHDLHEDVALPDPFLKSSLAAQHAVADNLCERVASARLTSRLRCLDLTPSLQGLATQHDAVAVAATLRDDRVDDRVRLLHGAGLSAGAGLLVVIFDLGRQALGEQDFKGFSPKGPLKAP